MNGDFVLNSTNERFELDVDGQVAFIEYTFRNNVMYLDHTEVPAALEGKGIGSKIVVKALEYIRDHNYKLAPRCPFVFKYMGKHPEWHFLLVEGYKV
jgi:predicted GNAT family acetyltransferase